MTDTTIALDLDTADTSNLIDPNAPGIVEAVSAAAAEAAVEAPAPVIPVADDDFRPLRPTTIRPGLLVVLRVSVKGNVSYTKEIIESETIDETGKAKEKWQTERTVVDPAEHDESTKIRSAARQTVVNVCTQTTFGLLCPVNREEELNMAIREARATITDFNRRAKTTKINMIAITGKVADSDVEAARAINSEVSDLMQTMEAGLRNLDVKAVRDAAEKARLLGSMLSEDASEKLKGAIKVARDAATAMKKAAETGAAEIDLVAIQKITTSRTAFLDHDMAGEVEAVVHEGRALDLAPVDETSIAPAETGAPFRSASIDLDIE